MFEKIKVRKIAVVIFLTLLIWVWADLALDTEKTFSYATISISKTANPNLWISFNEKPSINIKQFDLKGPVSKINEIEDIRNNNPDKFNFTLVPEEMDINKSGSYVLSVREILDKIDWIKDMGLIVVDGSCDPCEVNVKVISLVQKTLTVQCLDQKRNLQKAEDINPKTIDMYVPEPWSGDKLVAYVDLTSSDITKAITTEISKTPYIILASGQLRSSTTTVKIKMPPVANLRQQSTVSEPTLGYCFAPNLQGKYTVEITKEDLLVINTITIKATEAAKQAYENMLFQVILEIGDEDVRKAEGGQVIQKEVIYNFPRGLGEDEIQLVGDKVTARFKLIPVAPTGNP